MQAGIAVGNVTSAIAIRGGEAALVEALKAGSEEAFNQLIGLYSQPIYSLVARSIRDRADAADVTQDVFVKVFRSVRSFNGGASLRTWIYRIALHEASNQRRWWNRHKRQELTIDEPVESDEGEGISLAATLMSGEASPYQHTEQGELKARIEEGLRRLPESFRTVLVLREIEQFSYEEIAEIVNAPAGTVKSRLTRGRAALRQILTADGVLGVYAREVPR